MNTTPILLDLLFSLRLNLQLGKSVSFALAASLQRRDDPFSKSLKVWLYRFESGKKGLECQQGLPELTKTAARATFLLVLERGLAGSPIDENLSDLETEFFALAQHQYDRFLQILPLKLMLPLLLLILPGVFLLLIGPLLFTVAHGFSF